MGILVNAVMLRVVMPHYDMLTVIYLSVIVLCAVMRSVIQTEYEYAEWHSAECR
jgi:hypothetical protein